MRILAAYLGVIVIWSTTPLAIKWSSEGPGYLFGVAARMSIGLLCILAMLAILRWPMPFHRRALRAYLAVTVQIYGSMQATYWSSQFIPSGWISVVFGLTPLITALLSAVWLGERSLSASRLLSYAVGLTGLGVMFGSALRFGPGATYGIAGILLAAALQAVSSVWVKRLQPEQPALVLVAGGLLFAVPAYLLSWLWSDGHWPIHLPFASLASILYLGVIATPFGFVWYFYVVKQLPPTRVALITLITPVFSLLLGKFANAEALTPQVLEGTALILCALLLHELGGRGGLPATVESHPRAVKSRGQNSRGNAP